MLNFVNIQNNEDVYDILANFYPDILIAIGREEFYQIEYPVCSSFYEIKHEGKVVGFISCEYEGLYSENHIINEFYILPEFRGLNIGFNSLMELLLKPNFEFFLRKPNRTLINLFLKNNLAVKLPTNIVYCYIKFFVNTGEIYTNKKIKGIYKKCDLDFKGELFDLNTSTCCFFDFDKNCSKDMNIPVMILPRKGDIKKYKCYKKLKKVSRGYLFNKFDFSEKFVDIICDFEREVLDKLLDYSDLDKVVCSKNELSDSFIEKLNKHNLTRKDGFEIQKLISDAFNNDEISYESVNFRLNYLLSNFNNLRDDFDFSFDSCPFCGSPVRLQWKICENCGEILDAPDERISAMKNIPVPDFEITDDQKPLFTEFVKNLSDSMAKVSEAGGFDSYKLELTQEEIDYPCSEEIKQYFVDNLIEYDFFEFADYCINHENEDDLDTLAFNYIEDLLNKSVSEDNNPFDEYFRYILTLGYFYLYKDLFKSCVYLIQLIILDVAESEATSDLIDNAPHSIDIFYLMRSLIDKGFVGDIYECMDEAFATFRLSQFKNHEEELRKLIPTYFEN